MDDRPLYRNATLRSPTSPSFLLTQSTSSHSVVSTEELHKFAERVLLDPSKSTSSPMARGWTIRGSDVFPRPLSRSRSSTVSFSSVTTPPSSRSSMDSSLGPATPATSVERDSWLRGSFSSGTTGGDTRQDHTGHAYTTQVAHHYSRQYYGNDAACELVCARAKIARSGFVGGCCIRELDYHKEM